MSESDIPWHRSVSGMGYIHDTNPIRLDGRGDDKTIQRARGFELVLAFGGDEFMRTKLHGLIFLPIGSGEHRDVAAHLGCELDGHMT